MDATTPRKRRALAPLDANTRSPSGALRPSPSKFDVSRTKMGTVRSLFEPSKTKRPIEQENDQETPGSAKKRRLSGNESERFPPQDERSSHKEADDAQRPRSISPATSSVFDNSTIDNSHVTAVTEPDDEAAAPVVVAESRPRPRSMTREEARQKAEVLRLRLGLASYKVKTNQTDVPLERLQVRRLPGRSSPKQAQLPTSLPRLLAAPSPRRVPETCAKGDGGGLSSGTEKSGRSISRGALPLQRAPGPQTSACTAGDESPGQGQNIDPTLPPPGPNASRRRQLLDEEEDDEPLGDGLRGSAVKVLLDLSQGGPTSG
ncbi:hypothetical protein F5Y19DRAFT_119213 [Xylariaceae sp. FL1651]|nr:hypothetical protein F5Y19DRAFT_119213 [Xylariaceae sp. FL1651]